MHSHFSSPSPATRMRTGRPIFQTLFIPSNTRSRQQEPLQYLRRIENFPALHEFIGSMGLGDVVRTEGNGGNTVLRQNPRITKPGRADERTLAVSCRQNQLLHE